MKALSALQGEVNALTAQIDAFPGWEIGGLGTLGFSFSQFNNWYANENANAETTTFGLSANAFANYDQPKFFWNNSGNFVYTKTRLIPDANNATEEQDKFETTEVVHHPSLLL